MARCFLLLLAGLGLFPSSGASPSDAVAKELKAMAGTWRFVSSENNGYGASRADLDGMLWTRDDHGGWTMRRNGAVAVEWTVKALDPTTSPKTIDIEVAAGEYKGIVYLGIYELDGDTLRICFAMPDRPVRPTDFSARKGSFRALSEFERVAAHP